ncbi:hypothetical protein HELRODRAFT_159830 [Helobdella robusta]|uniref:Uncharacterized protein n=1 Tax=Helobdella robusta TaxID=6412 RepID=T1EPG3_HELRO|nr:hypothetical protein HELRODRAFT_159830 [Helobdella robusta]ESO13197.1 hypothetical protein HELRODRAFT_159830 [Helobdella robusta]
MDLMGSLDKKYWRNENPDKLKGWMSYSIIKEQAIPHNTPTSPNNKTSMYIAQENDGDIMIKRVMVEHVDPDSSPLHHVRALDLILNDPIRLSSEETAYPVRAMNIDGDCVVQK